MFTSFPYESSSVRENWFPWKVCFSPIIPKLSFFIKCCCTSCWSFEYTTRPSNKMYTMWYSITLLTGKCFRAIRHHQHAERVKPRENISWSIAQNQSLKPKLTIVSLQCLSNPHIHTHNSRPPPPTHVVSLSFSSSSMWFLYIFAFVFFLFFHLPSLLTRIKILVLWRVHLLSSFQSHKKFKWKNLPEKMPSYENQMKNMKEKRMKNHFYGIFA